MPDDALVIEKWLSLSRSTQPTNRIKATKAISDIYALLGLKAPVIVWTKSPLGARITEAYLHSTRRMFLRVPPDMKSPRQAVAWSFGLEEHEYDPAVET